MLEREFAIKRPPDNLPDRSPLLALARQDFANAVAITDSLNINRVIISRVYLKLVEDHVACGLDPSPLIQKMNGLSDIETDAYTKSCVQLDLSKAYATTGDMNAAHKVISEAESLLPSEVNSYPFRAHLNVARAKVALGQDPMTLLQKMQEIDESDKKRFRIGYLGYNDVQLIKAFASAGRFDLADSILDTKRGENTRLDANYRKDGLRAIARQHLVNGDIEQAMESARRSGDEALVLEIQSEAMVHQAKKGERFSQETYDGIVKRSNQRIIDTNMLTFVLSRLGTAKALSGENPADLYNAALRVVPGIPEESDRSFTYLDIARSVDEGNYDATPLIELALAAADRIVDPTTKPDIVEQGEQELAWQELADFAIEKGYLQQAREIVGRLKSDHVKAPLLSSLARAEFTSVHQAGL